MVPCRWYQGVTMETILTAANGIQAESQTNPDDPATKCATKALNPSLWANILVMIPLIGNTLAKWIMPTRFGFGYDDLEKLVRHIISERRKQGIENDTSKVSIFSVHIQTDMQY